MFSPTYDLLHCRHKPYLSCSWWTSRPSGIGHDCSEILQNTPKNFTK